jgi:hypothetical protein
LNHETPAFHGDDAFPTLRKAAITAPLFLFWFSAVASRDCMRMRLAVHAVQVLPGKEKSFSFSLNFRCIANALYLANRTDI